MRRLPSSRFVISLLAAGLAVLAAPASAPAQISDCAAAGPPVQSLICAYGVRPADISPLDSGGTYTAVSDSTATPYSMYLYPDTNRVPEPHASLGRSIGRAIVPLDAAGQVDTLQGKIVVVAEGFSNTLLEMRALDELYIAGNNMLNPRLVFRNLAEDGCSLDCWVDKPVTAPDLQVQVALLKHSNNRPQLSDGTPSIPSEPFPTRESKFFPGHALKTKDMLKSRILNLKAQYPNLKIVYLTSRAFGGWACDVSSTGFREPVAFEEGFSVKWLVEDQITGKDPDLAFDGPGAPAPWIAWGPYGWDAAVPRTFFQNDGTHPCIDGAVHYASLWYGFLTTHASAADWFLLNAVVPVEFGRFGARRLEDGILLEWETESESLNHGFDVQRRGAAEGSLWETLGFVRGQGTTASRTEYSFLDEVPPPGSYTYRLRQIDFDHSVSFSRELKVEVTPPSAFRLANTFPNPFVSDVSIRFDSDSRAPLRITIHAVDGRTVRVLYDGESRPGRATLVWDGTDDHGIVVPSGIYLVQILRDGRRHFKKATLFRSQR